jgi:hypothetical protein
MSEVRRLGDYEIGPTDAEADPNLSDYFMQTNYVESTYEGRRTLFLGRKGSGKSAVFTQIRQVLNLNRLSDVAVVQITPDTYAWSALRSYKEQGIGAEQAHTNAWKLTIAIHVAGMLVTLDRTWSPEVQRVIEALDKFLKDNYGELRPEFLKVARSLISGLSKFNLSAFGFGAGVELRGKDANNTVTPAVVAALTTAIRRVVIEQPVLVALDRLDDSWDGTEDSKSLIVGLVKASKDYNDQGGWRSTTPGGIRVLVFLRSDIYDSLHFDDKDKHRDTEQEMIWSESELIQMVNLRLPNEITLDDIVDPSPMRGTIKPISYIVRRTFKRPREVLQFLNECMRTAGNDAERILSDHIRTAEARYSRWKVQDLEQEFANSIPGYKDILEILRQGRQRYDSLRDFFAVLEHGKPGSISAMNVRRMAEVLLESSAIGVRESDTGEIKYKSDVPDLVLPRRAAVYVHPALSKGLGILETRAPREKERVERLARLNEISLQLTEAMMKVLAIQDLTWFQLSPKAATVIQFETLDECALSLGFVYEDDPAVAGLQMPNKIAPARHQRDRIHYVNLRGVMVRQLLDSGFLIEEYLRDAPENPSD